MIEKISLSRQDLEELECLKVNPADIQDDYYDYSKVVVKKPWGYEYLIFSNAKVAVWVLYLKRDAQTSVHCHPNKKTSLVVLEGKVNCSSLAGTRARSAGEGLLIDKGVFHQTTAVSKTGAFVMEIETPINKRDLVRLKDKYGRKGKGYETQDQYCFNSKNYNYISFQSNVKKHFGHCSMAFKKLVDSKSLNEILALDPEDVVCLLDGRLLNASGHSVLDIGDTVVVNEFRQLRPVQVDPNSEILIIKNTDPISKVSDIVSRLLNERNVKPIFIVPGDANVHLLDSIGRCDGLSYVCMRNEKSASFAVESFCKLRSTVGALVVSSGSSAISAVPGVANAWMDSVPMLVISGQARTDQNTKGGVRQLSDKSLSITNLVKSITKYAVEVSDPAQIGYHLDKAIYLATDGRPGPVWVDLPIDVQGMSIHEDELSKFVPEDKSSPKLKGQISQVMEMLKQASRPVILAGHGIRQAKAIGDFLALIERLKIPVLTSRRGADIIPDDHPWFFGRPGAYGQRSANFIIQNCDLLISIGSRLSIPLIGRNTKAFARAARKIVVDIDAHELQKPTLKIDLPIALDAGEFIRECLTFLPDSLPSCAAWLGRCQDWRAKFPPVLSNDSLSFVRMLSDEMNENDVIVADGGASLIYALQAFCFKSGQRLISSTGLELPGFALPAAIGACIARDSKSIVCLCEDHGFQNNLQELQTIIDYQLPIKILILKSRGHSIIRNIQRDYFGSRFVGTDHEIRLGSTSLARIAEIFGFPGATTLQELLKIKGPAVFEVQIEDDQDQIPRPGFIIREDRKWMAKPLEDMVPFLDRKTFQENMMIDVIQDEL